MTEYVSGAILGVGAVLVGLILVREVLCWYFKFSEQVRLLKAIEGHLEALSAQSRGVAPRPAGSPAAYPGSTPRVAPDGRRLTWRERLG